MSIFSDQIASNAATTSMLVPVIKTLAIKLEVHKDKKGQTKIGRRKKQ